VRERVCVCVPLPLCTVPVARIVTILSLFRNVRTIYLAALVVVSFGILSLLLCALASVNGAVAPLNFCLPAE
jgi:hypothetical protein